MESNMIGFLAAGLIVLIGLAAALLSPWREGILRWVRLLDLNRFRCRLELLGSDQPSGNDHFFHIEMTGRIPTPEDNYMTDIQIEIDDITADPQHPEPVLSADPQYQSGQDAIFKCVTCNGIVPSRNAVLARWITVEQIPCHLLRFAYRGRRKLRFRVSVLSAQTGQVLTDCRQSLDYVNCTDGYRQRQERRLEILKSSLLLAAMAGLDQPLLPAALETMHFWLDKKAEQFPPALQLKQNLPALETAAKSLSMEIAADRLLAWGEQKDKEETLELAIRTIAGRPIFTADRFTWLIDLAKMLSIHQDKFLSLAQSVILGSGTRLENVGPLLGLDPSMNQQQIIKQLNDEYRKWNGRVNHPDLHIRRQADQILSMIAETRSEQLKSAASII